METVVLLDEKEITHSCRRKSSKGFIYLYCVFYTPNLNKAIELNGMTIDHRQSKAAK